MRPYFIGVFVTNNNRSIWLKLKTTKIIQCPENEGTFLFGIITTNMTILELANGWELN